MLPPLGKEKTMKTMLEQLKAKGIALVEITFDGSGDSGGIEGIYCYTKNNQKVRAGEMQQALEELGYAILDYHHIAFDGEGCFGKISLEVESGKVEIEVNTRYTAYDTESHKASVDEYLNEGKVEEVL